MAIELEKNLSKINDTYEISSDRFKDYNKSFVNEIGKIIYDKNQKKFTVQTMNIINRNIERITLEISKKVEYLKESYTAKLKELQEKMMDKFYEKDDTRIDIEKDDYRIEISKTLDKLNDNMMKDVNTIINTGIDKMYKELLEYNNVSGLKFDKLEKEISDFKDHSKGEVSYQLKGENKRYKEKYDEWGRRVLGETASYLKEENREKQDTREEEYINRQSQEFNVNPGDQNRYDNFKKASELSKIISNEKQFESIIIAFSAYGISIKADNGNIIGNDKNGNPLELKEVENGFELTDTSSGIKYAYHPTLDTANVECIGQNVETADDEVKIQDVYYKDDNHETHVYLSNEKELYIYRDTMQIYVVDNLTKGDPINIPEEITELSEMINYGISLSKGISR